MASESGRAREVVLTASSVARSFGLRHVLVDASLSIHAGDRIGVVGLNGSGKTTLGRLLAGTDEPDAGAILRKRGREPRPGTSGHLHGVDRGWVARFGWRSRLALDVEERQLVR